MRYSLIQVVATSVVASAITGTLCLGQVSIPSTVTQSPDPLTTTSGVDQIQSPETTATVVNVSSVVPSQDTVDPKWWETFFDRLTISGDARFRHESSFFDSKEDRHRERIRVRLGAKYSVNDNVTVGLRLTTGNPEDPRSPYQDLGDGFQKFEISLDRAYLTWKPEELKGSFITVGKFSNPLYRNPVYGELVWDGDVQPEGAVAGYQWNDLGPLDELKLMAGIYTVLEQSSADEAWAYVIQASAKEKFTETLTGSAGIGYSHFGNPTPDGSTLVSGLNRGNAIAGGEFVSDFGIVNPIVALTYTGWEQPVTVSGEYIFNTRANIDEDQGFALGAAVGQTKEQGDWKAYYQYQVIEQDAVFSPWAQDDFLLTTNHQSHVFGYKYMLEDNLEFHIWSLVSQADMAIAGNDDINWRLRAEVTIKF